jgi:TolA-binding protein
MRNKPSYLLVVLAAFLITGVLFPALLAAQNSKGSVLLTEGLSRFRAGEYQQAVSSFRSIIFDLPEPSGTDVKPDAYYWIARSYIALNMLNEAERNLEYFLRSYSYHRLYPDALYQKGRLLFLQGEPESSIQVFQQFLEAYARNDLAANALYWVGEALYSLGQLDDAARVFNTVVNNYPRSFKVTEAGYRLSLIEFKKRENELLKLLKWSHEETLRVTEEFKRREGAYEQAISVYQHRLSAAGQQASAGQVESLAAENASLKQRIGVLEAQLAERGGEPDTADLYEELENSRRLLQAKAEALAVKEALLQALSQELENRQ